MQHKNEFLKDLLPLHFTQKEHDKARDWWRSHKCFLERKDGESFVMEGDALLPILKVHPWSMGHTIQLCCPYCNKEVDIYDDTVDL